MTNVIRVTFDANNKGDDLYECRLRGRLDDLKRVLEKSVKPWRVCQDPIFDDVGGVAGNEYEFVVDEFYIDVVKDMLRTLDWNNFTWFDWFRKKYGVSRVG